MADIKGGEKEFIDINRIQKILRGVAGIKSILSILAILRGVYGVMGPLYAKAYLSVSCRELPLDSAMERKNPCTA